MTSPDAGEQVFAAPLTFEYANLELLRIDPARPETSTLMDVCRVLVPLVAPEPQRVKVIITGDFVASVKGRLEDGPHRDAFTLERGTGLVGGKTMRVRDEIHVLFHDWMFFDKEAVIALTPADEIQELESRDEWRERHVRRTAVHEGQHVAMMQANEDGVEFAGLGWARKNFLSAAREVIGEYRAELGVPKDLREPAELDFPVEGLVHLRAQLYQIAAIDYQQDLNVDKLAYEVVQCTLNVWKLLAYLAAARRVFGIDVGAAPDHQVREHEAWIQMAAQRWDVLESALADFPPGSSVLPDDTMQAGAETIASLLESWLQSIGFTWRDVDVAADRSEFKIASWEVVLAGRPEAQRRARGL